MTPRTLLVLFTMSFAFLPALEAREFWNGSECVTCPEPKEYGPGEGNQPGGSDAGTMPQAGELARLLENGPLVSGPIQQQTESIIGAGNDSAMLYRLVGPIKQVDVERHRIVLKNRHTHKLESVYVYDPILPHLKERNVVEVWKKPGSDLAERIHRIS